MSAAIELIELKVVGTPPAVEFERNAEVSDDFWYTLSLYLQSRQSPDNRHQLVVPIERFLANRRWLQQHCRVYRVGLKPDEQIRALLQRVEHEREIVGGLLAGQGHTSDVNQIYAMLTSSRFARDLRDFQKRDLTKLLSLEHGANFSVPGGGKTAVTYALYELERLRGRVSRLLVVAPLSAFDAWESETGLCFKSLPKVRRFNGHIPFDTEVVLINYQKLASHYEELATWLLNGPTHLVLDEAHRAKAGRAGEWGSACLDLSHLAARRDILTGTPAPQSPHDFVALLDFLWPHQARRILPPEALQANPTDQAMQRVSHTLSPFFVRTTKQELGLDPPHRWVEWVDLTGLQADIYHALRNRYAGMFDLSRPDRTMLAQMGEVTIYLLQASTNPGLLVRRLRNQGPTEFRFPSLEIPPGSRLAEIITRYPDHEIPLKFKKLAVMVDRNVSLHRKTLIWSNFPDNLLALEQLLARYKPALIYGGIPSTDTNTPVGTRTRESELARFRADSNCLVLLANPAATAEGVSLHEVCHDAVYLDRTFNAGQYLQSLDRIHRLGLEPGTETRVTFLVTRGTIDESVDNRVAVKAERLSQMLNDPDLVEMALPDDEDYGQAIEDVGDLTALFEHLRGGND
jgi:SNF2 family DNA or RNA helicase